MCGVFQKVNIFYQFNHNLLSKTLANVGIKYENWSHEFGARQDCLDLYTDNIFDYEKFTKSQQFQSGLEKVIGLVNQNKNICFMCAEIDPINCHRAILCGKELYANGLNIEHIIAKRNGETFSKVREILKKDFYKQQR